MQNIIMILKEKHSNFRYNFKIYQVKEKNKNLKYFYNKEFLYIKIN